MCEVVKTTYDPAAPTIDLCGHVIRLTRPLLVQRVTSGHLECRHRRWWGWTKWRALDDWGNGEALRVPAGSELRVTA